MTGFNTHIASVQELEKTPKNTLVVHEFQYPYSERTRTEGNILEEAFKRFQYPYSERTRTVAILVKEERRDGFNTHIASVQELEESTIIIRKMRFNTHIASVQERMISMLSL